LLTWLVICFSVKIETPAEFAKVDFDRWQLRLGIVPPEGNKNGTILIAIIKAQEDYSLTTVIFLIQVPRECY